LEKWPPSSPSALTDSKDPESSVEVAELHEVLVEASAQTHTGTPSKRAGGGMNLAQALEIASCTDPGMVRAHNEDSIAADASIGLAVLADGMGGYNAGEVASGLATTVITSEVQNLIATLPPHRIDAASGLPNAQRLLNDQIDKANTAIYQAAQSEPQYAGMGTTLVVGLFYDNRVALAHIGDSRVYRLRGEQFERITKDHSLLQEQIDSGMITAEQARFSQNKNLVTRALGIDPSVEAEINDLPTRPGDLFLFCSDGLNDMVTDDDIGMTLQALSNNLKLAAQQLVRMANDNGGRDNVSVILVRIVREYEASKGVLNRLFGWLR
jgi:PPM family protein phosphatase